MKKANLRKLLEVKKELRYNDKYTKLLDDVIVDECGIGEETESNTSINYD